MSQLKLFSPIRVGQFTLQLRVVMAPMGRFRADANHVPTALMAEYYAQRASTPGTLIIAEATQIAAKAGGFPNLPRLEKEAEIAGWKHVTDAIHAQGSFVFVQLWATGRTALPEVLEAEGPFPYVSSSDVQLEGRSKPPRPLTLDEIQDYIKLYADAASNAIRAGFDGVEIHGATGHLIDQFIQDIVNKRTDYHGGTVENRCRFALQILDAVCEAVGEDRVAIRFSPWDRTFGMRMENPKPTFTYLVSEIVKRHPSLAYLHVVEPRAHDNMESDSTEGPTSQPNHVSDLNATPDEESNDFIREIWGPRPLISAGAYYNREKALQVAENKGDLIAFGRLFISNPDLPIRLREGIHAAKGDRSRYYTPGDPSGYIDYPFADGSVAPQKFQLPVIPNGTRIY